MKRLAALCVTTVLLVAAVGPVSPAAATAGNQSVETTCEYPFSAVDATGTSVTVSGRPATVVTLAPSAAQTVWEINGSD